MLPPWSAATTQVPAAVALSTLSVTLQGPESTEYVMPSPELALAWSVAEPSRQPNELTGGKVIVCAAFWIVTVVVTGAAAAKRRLPIWFASMVQVPAAVAVSVVPVIVQGPDTTVYEIGSPELALAGNVAEPPIHEKGPIEGKVMVCDPSATWKGCVTRGAAV